MSEAKIVDRGAQGRKFLALFLAVVLGFACYSGLAGFTDALAFARNSKQKLEPLQGGLGSFTQIVPASMSFGFYAPQVCSEWRLKMRLGNSATRQIREVQMSLGTETTLLVSSLSSSAQNEEVAKQVATSYASYGFTKDKSADSAEVRLEAEMLPRLRDAASGKSVWVPISTFYFKR